jgi:mannosyltransferase
VSTDTKNSAVGRWESWIAGAVVVFGLIIRAPIGPAPELWEDEIIAATHATQSFWTLLVSTVRYDVHPPLYFIQLHIWSLLSSSDAWLMANSLAWNIAAIACLWWAAGKLYGRRIGLIAAAVYAILPSPVYMADQVRMYSMLATLLILAFYLAHVIFVQGERRFWKIALFLLLLTAILLTHLIASIAVTVLALYCLYGALHRGQGFRLWCIVFAICGAFAMPWLIAGMMHDGNLWHAPGWQYFTWICSTTFIGIVGIVSTWALATGIFVCAATLYLGFSSKELRARTAIMIASPIALSILVGVLLKDVYKWNFFSTLEAPFIALTLAWALAGTTRGRFWLAALVVLCVCALTVLERTSFRENSGYREVAVLLQKNYRPGDVVYFPQPENFWGVAHYLLGPHWGSSIRTAAPPSPPWQKAYHRLGQSLVARLGLDNPNPWIQKAGFNLLVGPNTAQRIGAASRIWLVTSPGADLPKGYPPPRMNGIPKRQGFVEHTGIALYSKISESIRP